VRRQKMIQDLKDVQIIQIKEVLQGEKMSFKEFNNQISF
jgi:hypothetical protein